MRPGPSRWVDTRVADMVLRLRLIPRLYSRRVWALWLLGVVVILCIAELEPSVLVYLADPELLAATVVVATLLLRRGLRTGGAWVAKVIDYFFWYQLSWPGLAIQYLQSVRSPV